MPIYEYICVECGEKTEIWATISEKEKGLNIVCQKCGSKNMAQVFKFGGISCGSSSRREGNGNSSPTCCGSQAGPGCCG